MVRLVLCSDFDGYCNDDDDNNNNNAVEQQLSEPPPVKKLPYSLQLRLHVFRRKIEDYFKK